MNARMKLVSIDTRAKISQAKRLLLFGSVFVVLLMWTGGRNFLLGSTRRDLIQRIPDLVGAEMEMKMTPRNLTIEASSTTGLRPYQVRPVTSTLDQARLWNRARRMLGLHVSDNEVLIDPKQKDIAKRFYTQCGLQNLAMMNGNAVYVRIPKNGNNNIRCNILEFPGNDEDLRCLSKLEGAKLLSRGVKVWTFVRDPISRFVSGYTEVEYRNREDPNVQQQFEHPLGSKERFREYIVHMLEGRRIHAIYHTFSQSWIGTQFPVLNGGKVENMEEDWDSLQAWLGIKTPLPFNKVCSTHPTSADPLGTTAAAKRALEEDPALVNTLCALLFPDYVNFHYMMPKTCWETQDWAHLWTTED